MAKRLFFQSSIRILGKPQRSPKFKTKAELDRWLSDRRADKNLYERGQLKPTDEKILLKEYFYKTWLPKRKNKHTKATWGPDAQRFATYIEPTIGRMRVSRINTPIVKVCLEEVVTKFGVSPETRTKVKALLSKIFNDARNEKSPLRSDNPAQGIIFDDGKRVGVSGPNYMHKPQAILKYLEKAKEIGPTALVVASLGIMAGLRKQEMIPLTWGDFDEDEHYLRIGRKFVQAENKIMDGTKRGAKSVRIVPISDELCLILKRHRTKSDFQAEDDFILSKEGGGFYGPRGISNFTEATRALAGIDVTTHGLRHTYGRLFAVGSGNMKALQTILGHSNSQTTELYSKLGGDAVTAFRNTVTFNIKGDDDE